MEPTKHGCSARLCKTWWFGFGALCGISFGILTTSNVQATVSPDSQGFVLEEEHVSSAGTPQIPDVTPSRVAPRTDESTAGAIPTPRVGSESFEDRADASRVSNRETFVSAVQSTKSETLRTPISTEGGIPGVGDRGSGPEGEKSGNLQVEDSSNKPLSVAERVRMRFHSQRLFQDEGENENGEALDPLPQLAAEDILKDAQEESTSTESRTRVVCLSNCSMHGECTPYGCSCAPGWGGVDCSSRSCIKNCSGNGVCVDGTCKCTRGFRGADCSEREDDDSEGGGCPNDCSGNGTCDPFTRQCTCNDGFVGRSCGEERCPNNCLPNGKCADNGRCTCQLGYGGADCSMEICPKNCSGLGICSSIGCLCYEGSGGVDCSQPQKPSRATPFGCASDADCSNRGACESGRCNCNTGFEGDCSELARDIFSAVCKHSSSLYVLAFDENVQPSIKTW